jgi:hypothetical protein
MLISFRNRSSRIMIIVLPVLVEMAYNETDKPWISQ